jgi:uncharacterized protein (DUF2267 family)
MSATGLEVFDKTVQTTNIWLDEIMDQIGPARHTAWHVLGATLHALRDRLTIDQAAHLGAQLPLLVRGLYYDQWHPASMPSRDRSLDEFLAHVGNGLRDTRPVNVREAVETVFRVLAMHISKGQADKVAGELPAEIRALWPSDAQRAADIRPLGAELERAS